MKVTVGTEEHVKLHTFRIMLPIHELTLDAGSEDEQNERQPSVGSDPEPDVSELITDRLFTIEQ